MSLMDAMIESESKEYRDEFEELKEFAKELIEVVDLACVCLESIAEDQCRYDHNRNCQEHGWFGLDGDDCPVEKWRRAREIQKHEMYKEMKNENI
jgi:hypothetical protein